jgi:hypothetical protein
MKLAFSCQEILPNSSQACLGSFVFLCSYPTILIEETYSSYRDWGNVMTPQKYTEFFTITKLQSPHICT